MSYVTAATSRFTRRQAIRQLARDARANAQANDEPATGPEPEPMRKPDTGFENPLSPAEVEQGVRDRTFKPPMPRDLRPDRGGGYVTKGEPGNTDPQQP
jgi:hypothetical protein